MTDADFRTFIKDERQRLIHYVRSRFRETAEMDAEDVVHDVLVKMLEKSSTAAAFGSLTNYVYRSVKNRVIDFRRTRKSTVSLTDGPDGEAGLAEPLEDGAPNALEILQTHEGEKALFEALNALSEVERRVVIAHEFEGISFRELSLAMHMPQNTLLSHKSRALKKLKEYFLRSK